MRYNKNMCFIVSPIIKEKEMCKKSPLMKLVGILTWKITALASIHLGLVGLSYNIFDLPLFQTTLATWVTPIHYIIGVAGVISMAMLLWKWFCWGSCYGSSSCCSDGKSNPGVCPKCGCKPCRCQPT